MIKILTWFVAVSTICCFLLTTNTNAQQLRRHQAIAAYIYNFAKNVQWQKEEAVKEFHIRVIGEDQDVIQEMTTLSKSKTLRNKPIVVSSSTTLGGIDKAQLIFITKDAGKKLIEVFDKIEGKDILLVSDGYQDKRLVMINFIESDKGTLLFEINKANILNQQLRILPDMILLGGTEIDVAELYREGQENLRSLQKHIENLENNLSHLEDNIKAKTREIQVQKDSLNSQTLKIQEQQKILDIQSQGLIKREKQLDTLIQRIQEQQKILEKGNVVLQDQQKNIDRQKSEILSQSKILEEQGATIHKQQSLVYLLVTIIVLVAVLVFTLYSGYKSKKKLSRELEMKVEERTNELRNVNEQLLIELTERKHAEARLAESEQKYRELVEHANSIILRWRSDGQITFLNEFGQRFFGYSAEEILGRHVIGTIVPITESSGRDLRQIMEQICADPKAFEQNINENMRRNGERVWIAWTNRIVLDARGQVAEIFSVGTDITERKLAEAELDKYRKHLEEMVKERTAELVIAKELAESADRLKSAFLATMSHELRTPLNSIIGFTGILMKEKPGPLNAEQKKQLGMTQNSARHLLSLINDVLDISKIEAGQLQLRFEKFNLIDVIEKVKGIVTPLAESKNLELQTIIQPGIGEISSDMMRVKQVLLNIANNAVKFTEKGFVRIECFRTHSDVVVKVVDTGIGIEKDKLDFIFKPFSQIDTGLSRNHEGTGLGLSISKKLITMLNGTISVGSEVGVGSTFTITLPLRE